MTDQWQPPAWWTDLAGTPNPSVHIGELTLQGRPLLLAALVVSLLAITALPALLGRNKDIRDRWITWLVLAVLVGPLVWSGPWPTAVLAGVLSAACVIEYTRLLHMKRLDRIVLLTCSVTFPAIALAQPNYLNFLPVLILLTPILGVITSDTERGGERAAYVAFGIVWLCWAPAHLVLIYTNAFLIILAVAVTDVASWAGGKTLGKLPGLKTTLGPVSPNKTIGGLVGGAVGAALILSATGSWDIGLFLAVAAGAPLGDLIESLFKRQAKVKDAGNWLPGFGGLLDRVDSLLIVLPLAAVLAP